MNRIEFLRLMVVAPVAGLMGARALRTESYPKFQTLHGDTFRWECKFDPLGESPFKCLQDFEAQMEAIRHG